MDEGGTTMDLLVRTMTLESEGVLSVILEDPGGGPLPGWEQGAHLELELGGLPRHYSLCGTPEDSLRYRIAVLRDPDSRGGSAHVHERLRPGDLVTVRGPRNRFPLVTAERYLFVAGGIGITPLLPMIAAVEAAGVPWRLAYGGRRRASMAFQAELAAYGDAVTLLPEDELGRMDLKALLGTPDAATAVYCCGPEGLLAAVEEACAAWPEGSLHVERFAAAPRAETDAGAEREFEVECRQSGVVVTVPRDEPIIDALEAAGVWVASACREGICGSCETKVVEGEPDHRDSLLTAQERASGTTMMPCVSRAFSGRLVLDL
ncbi:PDR/VanB family oxidoreductase [Streptosporangium sp. NPDC049046]|uniref:PDR/VanB family oxidoreductase n=1 Tax=Streptosporangium sp. NPDC049046 TaxID=3155031 RepID=UPI0034235841